MKKIIIYGGTFDPIHNGHLKIAQHAKDWIQPHEFYWVPTGTNPFKKGQVITDSSERLQMLKLVLPAGDQISEFEIKRNTLSYTKDTINYFKQKFPNDQLYLLIGSDLLSKLHKWEGIDQIASQAQILVAKRSRNFSKINVKKFKGIIMDNPILEFSSSDVRKGDYTLVPPIVKDYYAQRFLYLQSYMRKNLSIKRSKHCFETAKLAGEYAKLNNLKYDQGFYAGLVHDVTKEWSTEQHLNLLDQYYPQHNFQAYQYHQYSAALWFKYIYGNNDQQIFQALANHTSLEIKPLTILDKIVFLADKLAYGRTFTGIQKVRELAKQDLNTAFKQVLKINLQFLQQKNGVDPITSKHYEGLINE